jgi:hypothetical protein
MRPGIGQRGLLVMLLFVFQHNVLPIFSRPDPVQLRVCDTKLTGNHLQAILIIPEQFLYHLHLALRQLIVAGPFGLYSVQYVWISPVMLNHLLLSCPAQVLHPIVQLVMVKV